MVAVPTFIDIPTFGAAASKTQPSPTVYANGYLVGQAYPAENHNFFMNGLTGNSNTEQTSIISLLTEFTNLFTAYGVTPDPLLFNQFLNLFQGQLALKAPLASPTFTGTVTIPTVPEPVAGGNPTTKTYVDAGNSSLQSQITTEAATARNASNLSSGTVPLARLSSLTDAQMAAGYRTKSSKLSATGDRNLPAMNAGDTFEVWYSLGLGPIRFSTPTAAGTYQVAWTDATNAGSKTDLAQDTTIVSSSATSIHFTIYRSA